MGRGGGDTPVIRMEVCCMLSATRNPFQTNWHDLLSSVNKDHFNKHLLQLIYNVLTVTSADDQICDKNIFYLVT